MPIDPATIAAYAPWGNAQLAFTVEDGVLVEDPATGNQVPGTETLEYLAALDLTRPSWQKAEGADQTLYQCTGRLLEPPELDRRITNGSKAQAIVNGYSCRLEFTFDLAMLPLGFPTVRQSVQGTLRVIGGGHATA
jgi:hypothetical protein